MIPVKDLEAFLERYRKPNPSVAESPQPGSKKKEIIAGSPIDREVEYILSTFARVDPPLKADKLHYTERKGTLWISTKYKLENELWRRYNSVLKNLGFVYVSDGANTHWEREV